MHKSKSLASQDNSMTEDQQTSIMAPRNDQKIIQKFENTAASLSQEDSFNQILATNIEFQADPSMVQTSDEFEIQQANQITTQESDKPVPHL